MPQTITVKRTIRIPKIILKPKIIKGVRVDGKIHLFEEGLWPYHPKLRFKAAMKLIQVLTPNVVKNFRIKVTKY